jgi:hypothetical protein
MLDRDGHSARIANDHAQDCSSKYEILKNNLISNAALLNADIAAITYP